MIIERRVRQTKPLPIVALIDILFQLLIFFMLATSFVRQESLELALPHKSAAIAPQPAVKPQILRVKVQSGGQVQLNNASITGAEFNEKLRKTFNEAPESAAIIESDEGVNLQELVSVMDMIYSAGGKNLALAQGKKAPIPLHDARISGVS